MTENIKIKYAGPSVEDVCFSVTTSGSVGTVLAVFSFDEEWDGFPTKTAIFATDAVVKQVLLDGENACIVPWEVLEEGGYIEVGVVGQNGEKILPSTKTRIHILDGIYTKGTEPEDPAPSIYEQIVQIMQQTLSVAQSVREDADAGKFDGKDGKDGKDGEQGPQGPAGATGAKGDKGADGKDGKNGADGYTPQRGIDYWTEEDVAAVRGYVNDSILGGVW